MAEAIDVLIRYQQADCFGKMCLFLQHRDLRDVFHGIDLKKQP